MAKLFSRALVALLFTLPAFLYAAPRVVTLSPANTELALPQALPLWRQQLLKLPARSQKY
jgi:hypothetical protein